MAQATKGAIRSMKNVAKGYSELQIKVREATSNDPFGPSTELMHQIATHTHSGTEFSEIIQILSKRLNDHGRNWRHVLKALILLDFLIHCGSEHVVEYARENLYVVKTLKEFQYIHDGLDCGANVRQKAKELAELLVDEDRIQRERKDRSHMVNRIMSDRYSNDHGVYRSNSLDPGREPSSSSSSSSDLDQYEEDVRRAIRESLKTIEEDKRRQMQKSNYSVPNLSEEEELRQAIELSKKEEEERQIRMYGVRLGPDQEFPYASSSSSGSSSSSSAAPLKKPSEDLIDLLSGQQEPIQPMQSMQPQPTVFDPFGVAAPAHHPFHVPMGYPAQAFSAQPNYHPQQQPQQLQGTFLASGSVNARAPFATPQPPLTLSASQPLLGLPAPQPLLALPAPPASGFATGQPSYASEFNPFGPLEAPTAMQGTPAAQALIHHGSGFASQQQPQQQQQQQQQQQPLQPSLLPFAQMSTTPSQASLASVPSSAPSIASQSNVPSQMVNLDQLTANNPFSSATPAAFQWHREATPPLLSLHQLSRQPPTAANFASTTSVQMHSTFTSAPANNNAPSFGTPPSSTLFAPPPPQPSQAKTNPFLL